MTIACIQIPRFAVEAERQRRNDIASRLILIGEGLVFGCSLDILEGSPLVAELSAPDRLADRLSLKTLLMPGGLGSTHTVMVFAKR